MATFQYEALDTKTGKTEKGEMPANSQAEALSRLQEMGLAPTSVEEAKPASKSKNCLLYTSPSPRDRTRSRMPSSA